MKLGSYERHSPPVQFSLLDQQRAAVYLQQEWRPSPFPDAPWAGGPAVSKWPVKPVQDSCSNTRIRRSLPTIHQTWHQLLLLVVTCPNSTEHPQPTMRWAVTPNRDCMAHWEEHCMWTYRSWHRVWFQPFPISVLSWASACPHAQMRLKRFPSTNIQIHHHLLSILLPDYILNIPVAFHLHHVSLLATYPHLAGQL